MATGGRNSGEVTEQGLSSKDWAGKASAGLVLGFLLAAGLAGLLFWSVGAGDEGHATRAQFAMWIISPIWCGILTFCFLFRSGFRAWTVLGLACALVWATLYLTGAMA